MSDFADHAAVALTLAATREQARELTIIADRDRIAHDLHDHVIQRLFAVGMNLQGTIARSRSPEIIKRLNRDVDDLQTPSKRFATRSLPCTPPEPRATFVNRCTTPSPNSPTTATSKRQCACLDR